MTERYCLCRTRSTSGYFVACESCRDWFHPKCIGLTKKVIENYIDVYYCDECKRTKPNLEIKYKPAYYLQSEKKPITKQEPLEERKQEKKVPEKNQLSLAPSKAKSKPITPAQQKDNQGKKRVSQKTKSKGYIRKQCANPDCVLEASQDSKYCSDECGYNFNKMRYETHFIPKWRILEENHSEARLKKMKDLEQLEKDKVEVEQLIRDLKTEKEELEKNISIIKEQAKKLSKENANSKENDDDVAEVDNDDVEEITSSDLTKTYCITCGMTIQVVEAFKHWSKCHKKHEAGYNFTADVLVNYSSKDDENPKLYCLHQDKKSKRYCMYIESACPLHSNWQSDKDEVCGCPLNIMQKLNPDGVYCLEMKKDCSQHYHWDKFRLAQMNMQRAQAFSRLDIITDRIRVVTNNLADTYGGVVGVMLHNTINHLSIKGSPDNELPYEEHQEEIDVEMPAE